MSNSSNVRVGSHVVGALPVDDIAPAITEGNQILSLSVTTTSATQKTIVEDKVIEP